MTGLRGQAFRMLMAAASPGAAFGMCLFWPDLAQGQGNALPVMAAAAPEFVAPAREAAAWLVQDGARLSLLAAQFVLVLGILNLVWQVGRWVLARPPLGAVAAPALGMIAIVAMAGGFAMLGPVVAGFMADTAMYIANGRELPATIAVGEEILPSAAMVSWVERLVAWIGEVEANPASWAYLGCAFVSTVVLGTVLGVSVVIHVELFVVSVLGLVVLTVEDINAESERQDAFADPANDDAAPLPVLGSGDGPASDAAKRYVTSVLGKGVKLMTLLLAVGVTGRVSREVGHAAGAGTLEDALSVVLLQVACVVGILVLPAALERRVLLGSGP